MTSEQNSSGESAGRWRPTRGQRIVAAGFLGAFALTILTVLLTGLWVRSPGAHRGSGPPPAAADQAPPAPAVAPTPEPRTPPEGAAAPSERATDPTVDELRHSSDDVPAADEGAAGRTAR